MTLKLFIATGNYHKIAELKDLFRTENIDVDLYSFHQFPNFSPQEETGKTLEENARQKALFAAKTVGMTALADDSGLVVPALDGAPGVYSARYAGQEATDKENRALLLQNLRGKTGLERNAFFECCLVVAHPEQGVLFEAKGRCEGTILDKERGRNGFGYDPLFQKHEWSKSFAEIDDRTKNRVSHRRRAFEKFLIALESGTLL